LGYSRRRNLLRPSFLMPGRARQSLADRPQQARMSGTESPGAQALTSAELWGPLLDMPSISAAARADTVIPTAAITVGITVATIQTTVLTATMGATALILVRREAAGAIAGLRSIRRKIPMATIMWRLRAADEVIRAAP